MMSTRTSQNILELPGGAGVPTDFLELPTLIYGDDPKWIPEEPEPLLRTFGANNPWFQMGEAKSMCVPKKARLATFFEPNLHIDGRKAAYFGYFESVGDGLADKALFEHASTWACMRGAEDLYGPINFNTFGNYRILLHMGDDGLPFPDEPYNPLGYATTLETQGFELYQYYVSQVGLIEKMKPFIAASRTRFDQLVSEGYRFEPLSHGRWLDNLEALHPTVDSMFGENLGYTPLSLEAFKAKCGEGFIRRTCPHTSVLAHDSTGAVAGFFLLYPHYGPICVQNAGASRVPASELSYEAHAAMLYDTGHRSAILKTVGVAPEHRKKGLMAALLVSSMEQGAHSFHQWYGALIRQGNFSERYGGRHQLNERRYGLYRKRLT
jgi:GNAT superfamily N-acetyltransferase